MKNVLLAVLSLFLIADVAIGQKRPKGPTKKPIIRATVTVTAEPYEPPNYPDESEAGLWNEFSTKDGSITLSFPSRKDGSFYDDSEIFDDGVSIFTLSARTKNATYKLITRPVAQIVDNRDIDDVLETSLANAYSGPGVEIVSKRNVRYASFVGKDVLFKFERAEGTYIERARLFILDGKMIAIYVSLDHEVDLKLMTPWIDKFFDSLLVRMPIPNES